MILASHVIFSAYGHWLPNDPRGSWSEFVGAWDLFRAGGRVTTTTESRSLAADPHDRGLRLATKRALARPPVRFTGVQARAIGRGLADYVAKFGLVVWACAIMPDHVHLIVGRCRILADQLMTQLKAAATTRLLAEGIHPFAGADGERVPKCFGRGGWTVFFDTPAAIPRAIRYVENNPVRDGLPPQRWPFVKPYTPF